MLSADELCGEGKMVRHTLQGKQSQRRHQEEGCGRDGGIKKKEEVRWEKMRRKRKQKRKIERKGEGKEAAMVGVGGSGARRVSQSARGERRGKKERGEERGKRVRRVWNLGRMGKWLLVSQEAGGDPGKGNGDEQLGRED